MTPRTDCERILAVLEEGGPRKPNVLGGMLGSRSRADAAIEQLHAQKKVSLRMRHGGRHVHLRKERGFAIPSMTQALIVLGVVAAIVMAVLGWLSSYADKHYQRGQLAERAEWNKKEEERRKAEKAKADRVAAALLLEQQRAQAAEARADQAEREWKEARRANRNKPLASCPVGRAAGAAQPVQSAGGEAGPELAAAPAGAAVADDPAPVRLLWRFVGLHDGAFTDANGEPLFGAAARYALAPERADADSPYGLADALDVAGENAAAHSECLRKFDEAMNKIRKAAEAWNGGTR